MLGSAPLLVVLVLDGKGHPEEGCIQAENFAVGIFDESNGTRARTAPGPTFFMSFGRNTVTTVATEANWQE